MYKEVKNIKIFCLKSDKNLKILLCSVLEIVHDSKWYYLDGGEAVSWLNSSGTNNMEIIFSPEFN